MPWGAVAGAAIVAGGTYMASQSAQDAANTQANAYRDMSNLQYQRAQEAAGKVPEFRPVTVTSSFGTPKYTYDESGRLTGVSSEPAPWLTPLQQRQQALAGQYLNLQEQGLLNTGGQTASNLAYGQLPSLYSKAAQALPESYDTTQATQDYYNRMQQLVAPQREQQLARTRQGLFNTGRTGLATGATQAGGMLATNPEMAAYYNALAQQDLELANRAEQQSLANLAARQNLGTGLLTSATGQAATGGNALNQYYTNLAASQVPYTTGMSQLSSLEGMINQPVTSGMQYGGITTNQANQIANAYIAASGAGSQALANSINAQAAADAQNPWAGALMGFGSAIGSANWSSLGNSGGQVSSGGGVTGQGAAGASQLLPGGSSSIPGVGGGSGWGQYGVNLGGWGS